MPVWIFVCIKDFSVAQPAARGVLGYQAWFSALLAMPRLPPDHRTIKLAGSFDTLFKPEFPRLLGT
eukprot:scaffold32787_cov19-Tisochrysis_lutea.AAC.1